jgi:hypothetical protein
MDLLDHWSPAVATRLSSVIDLERLGPVTAGIAAAAPKRTVPTGSLHHVRATHRTSDDGGLNLSWFICGVHSGLFIRHLGRDGASRSPLPWRPRCAPDDLRCSRDGPPFNSGRHKVARCRSALVETGTGRLREARVRSNWSRRGLAGTNSLPGKISPAGENRQNQPVLWSSCGSSFRVTRGRR